MRIPTGLVLSAFLLVAPLASVNARTPDTWDGLFLSSDNINGTVYLLPSTDFRKYSKVMLDPTEVAFQRDWQKNEPPMRRISGQHMRRILDEAGVKFEKRLVRALQEHGYKVVDQPGDDVLRIWPAIVNLSFVVPVEGSVAHTFSQDSGVATLVIEARDSVSGALLGRALDVEVAGDDLTFITNRVTLWQDFEYLFDDWSKRVVSGLDRIRASPPLDPNQPAR